MRPNVSSDMRNKDLHPEDSVLQIKLCDSLKAFQVCCTVMLDCDVLQPAGGAARLLYVSLPTCFLYVFIISIRHVREQQVNANCILHFNETIH